MDVLVVGRSRSTVDTAIGLLETWGFAAQGATADEEALTALDTRRFRALLIGGGVEPASRDRLKDSAGRRDVTVLEARRNGRDLEVYLREEVVPVLREPD